MRSGQLIDIPFFSDALGAAYVEPDTGPNPPQAIADAMHGACSQFAITGATGWPAYHEKDSMAVMIFDEVLTVAKGVHGD